MRLYRVIYKVIEDINAARVGMLHPTIEEHDTARIEVREVFRVPKIGVIAGCYVTEGEVFRDDQVRIVRDGAIICDGKIDSLRRFKDDVKSVQGRLRVRHRHRGLPGPQGRRRHRVLQDRRGRTGGVGGTALAPYAKAQRERA